MGRTSLACVLAAAAAGSAQAGPKKTVQIDSKPPKASVFIGTTDNGETCKTPCSVEIDGETTLIVSLDGHRPKIDQIAIRPRDKPPYKRSYVLEAMLGQLKVEGPAGAAVLVDNVEKGKIPFSDDVPAGKRTITVKLDGKEVYSNSVEIVEDEESKITVTAKGNTNVAKGGGDEPDPDGPETPDPKIKKPGTPKPRGGALFRVSAASTVGFRKFTYKNVPATTTREDRGEETENGQVLAGPMLEVWLGNLVGIRPLRGLSLAVRAQFGLNKQTVIENQMQGIGVQTFWGSVDASLRQKWIFGDAFGVEVNAGFAQDQFQYTGLKDQILKVPDVIYQSVRIGGRASYVAGSFEPYLGFDTRIVMSGGNLQTRFPAGATANGFGAHAGVSFVAGKVLGGKISGNLEGSLTRYTWTFTPDNMVDADGATDAIAYVGFTVGYAY